MAAAPTSLGDTTLPVEGYLDTVLSLSEEGVAVMQARVAERVRLGAASPSEMPDRRREDGDMRPDSRRLSQTQSGQTPAGKVVRTHRLTVEERGEAIHPSRDLSDRLDVGVP